MSIKNKSKFKINAATFCILHSDFDRNNFSDYFGLFSIKKLKGRWVCYKFTNYWLGNLTKKKEVLHSPRYRMSMSGLVKKKSFTGKRARYTLSKQIVPEKLMTTLALITIRINYATYTIISANISNNLCQ